MTESSITTNRSGARSTGARSQQLPLILFSALVGVSGVLIVLQGVWAGVFIREGQDNNDSWVEVHDWGARAAILFALLATVVAVARLRRHLALVFGAAALFVLLFVEAYIGGLIGDSPGAEAVHFPLALALVGLAVWLPMRARSIRTGVAD